MVLPRMWDAGVDYVRLTCARGRSPHNDDFDRYENAARSVAALAINAPPACAWGLQGYRGFQVASVCWGERDDGCILQVSGGLADEVPFYGPHWTGVPRLDMQVTVWGLENHASVPRAAADLSEHHRGASIGRPWRITYIDGRGAGDTVYLGSRQSEVFVRIYDKAAETGDEEYATAVRFEVELKGEEAARVYSALPAGFEAHRAYCAGVVRGRLLARGLDLPDWVQVSSLARGKTTRTSPTTASRIEWLRKQCVPTIRRLEEAGLTRAQLDGILFPTTTDDHLW